MQILFCFWNWQGFVGFCMFLFCFMPGSDAETGSVDMRSCNVVCLESRWTRVGRRMFQTFKILQPFSFALLTMLFSFHIFNVSLIMILSIVANILIYFTVHKKIKKWLLLKLIDIEKFIWNKIQKKSINFKRIFEISKIVRMMNGTTLIRKKDTAYQLVHLV